MKVNKDGSERKIYGEYNDTFKMTSHDHYAENVVYLLSYDDGSRYIGSTRTFLRTRVSKHYSAAKQNNTSAKNTLVNKANRKAMKNEENVIVTVLRKLEDNEILKEVESKYIKFYKEHSKCFNMNS